MFLARHTAANGSVGGNDEEARQISLFLRYYLSADRAFNRNLHDLRKLQKERRENETEIGFVPRNAAAPPLEPAPKPVPTPPALPREPVLPVPATGEPVFEALEPQKQAA